MNEGAVLKRWRKRRGLSQEELAEKVNVSTMSIRRYESGARVIPDKVLKRVIEVLDITAENTRLDHQHSAKAYDEFLHTSDHASPYAVIMWALSKLTDEGQRVAVERVEELTQIPKYQATHTENSPKFNTGAHEWEKTGDLSTKQEKPPEGEFKPNDGNA